MISVVTWASGDDVDGGAQVFPSWRENNGNLFTQRATFQQTTQPRYATQPGCRLVFRCSESMCCTWTGFRFFFFLFLPAFNLGVPDLGRNVVVSFRAFNWSCVRTRRLFLYLQIIGVLGFWQAAAGIAMQPVCCAGEEDRIWDRGWTWPGNSPRFRLFVVCVFFWLWKGNAAAGRWMLVKGRWTCIVYMLFKSRNSYHEYVSLNFVNHLISNIYKLFFKQ